MNNKCIELIIRLASLLYKTFMEGSLDLTMADGKFTGEFATKNGLTITF